MEDTIKTAEIKLNELKVAMERLGTQKSKLEAHLEHIESERQKLLENAEKMGIDPGKIDELIEISEDKMKCSIKSCQEYITEINALLVELKESFN